AGVASWFDFAIAIGNAAVLAGLVSKQIPIVPISSAEFPARAIRPAFSVLDTGATIVALGIAPRHWSEPLRETIAVMAGSSAVNVGTNRSSSA
ncbi:MAG: sugar nucleotide-binding protein, partial [Gemmatimonadota bacterium]